MPASLSGNNINITGTGNTLESIANDISDTSILKYEEGVLILYGNVVRYFSIQNGGELIIGDPSDYSVEENFDFEATANNNLRFTVSAGGHLKMYGNTKIDFMTGAGYPYSIRLYGSVTVLGNATYKPVWQNYYRVYLYEQQTNNSYNDIWHFENMIMGSASSNNLYGFYFAAMGKVRNHIFKNITFDKSYGKGYQMYPINITKDFQGVGNITFENINMKDTGYYQFYIANARPHLKQIRFGTTPSWKCLVYGTGNPDKINSHYAYENDAEYDFGQSFTYFENCTFANENSKNCVLINHHGTALFKDCTWDTDAGNSITAQGHSKALMWAGNTFTTYEHEYLNVDGMAQWVYGLNLTVNDEQGNPMENAVVYIEQSQGKERFIFITKSNGKLHTDHDLEVALLTNIHQYGSSKTSNIEKWSDSSEGTYHVVTVLKNGYRPYTFNIVMDSEKSQTIQLDRIDAHASVF